MVMRTALFFLCGVLVTATLSIDSARSDGLKPNKALAAAKLRVPIKALTGAKGLVLTANPIAELRSLCDIGGQMYGAAPQKVVLLDAKGGITRTIATSIASPTIARYNASTMIIGDTGAKIIYTLDLKTGQTSELLSLNRIQTSKLPRAAVIQSGKLASVASDGKYLFVAFSAGFSSSILKIDPASAAVIGHTWAPGDNPAAMVYDRENLFVLEATGKQIRRFDQALKPSYTWLDVPVADGKGLILTGDEFKVLSPTTKSIIGIQTNVSQIISASTTVQILKPSILEKLGDLVKLPQQYAVLITGDLAESCYYCDSFWNDTLWLYKTLLANGYQKQNIYVLYGNGVDFASANPKYQYGDTVTDFPATIDWVNTVFDGLKNGDATHGIQKLTANDTLFVWTFDHGSGNNPAYLCLMNGDMSDTSFASKLNAVTYGRRAIFMQQCRSGGFIDNLKNNQTFISTACRAQENAHAADTENEVYNGQTYWHGEYNYYLTCAMSGATPSGGAVNADSNSDGKVSARESHDWVVSHESRSEIPQMDDAAGIGGLFQLK